MKIARFLLLGLYLVTVIRAQTATPPPPVVADTTQRTPATLDTLLGPIALYPDPLVALILPAATTPSDVVLASRYLDAKNDPAAVDNQPWSESVKALVHYPDVLKWMNDNLEWTQALGQAFLDQPADVMNSVQRLRARAKASGALVSTPQQQVTDQGGLIVIEPAQPDIVYVPIYDPAVVYIRHTVWVDGPFISFGFGYPIGAWFIYDCDWDRRTVWVISRPHDWRDHPRYWQHTGPLPQNPPGHSWHPSVNNHPRPPGRAYAHPPTPRPIRTNTDATQSANHAVAHPREATVPQTVGAPAASPRPSRAPRKHDDLPVAPNDLTTIPPPPATPHLQSPSVVVKPPVLTHPSRPLNSENIIDRSHHPLVTPPAARSVPASPTPASPTDTDPKKTKQLP